MAKGPFAAIGASEVIKDGDVVEFLYFMGGGAC